MFGAGGALWGMPIDADNAKEIPEGESRFYDLSYEFDPEGSGNFEVENRNVIEESGQLKADLYVREAEKILPEKWGEAPGESEYIAEGDYIMDIPGEERVKVEVEEVNENGAEVALEYESSKVR